MLEKGHFRTIKLFVAEKNNPAFLPENVLHMPE